MTPRYGRAPRGERVVGTAPRNHGPNTSLVAALTLDGITAAMTVEGAVDRPAFDAFVVQVLAPRLHPGQVVIWDNLSVHKSDMAQRVIAARGCQLLWLPPYSPDFSPIEQAFSKLKTSLRRAAERGAHPRGAGCGHHGGTDHDHGRRRPGPVRPLRRPDSGPTHVRTALTLQRPELLRDVNTVS